MKRRLVSVLAASALVALGACSSSSTTATTASTAAAPSATKAPAPTAGATIGGAVLASRMVEALTKAGSGKATITTEGGTGAAANAMTGTTEFSIGADGQISSKGTINAAGLSMDVIAVGGVVYLKSSAIKASNGAPWVKIDPKGTDTISKTMGSQLKDATDPRQQIEAYKGSTATFVGTEGDLFHYTLSGLGGATAGAVAIDMWLDGQDRPAKTTVSSSGLKFVSTYSDFGAPVTVTAPAADQVGTYGG